MKKAVCIHTPCIEVEEHVYVEMLFTPEVQQEMLDYHVVVLCLCVVELTLKL